MSDSGPFAIMNTFAEHDISLPKINHLPRSQLTVTQHFLDILSLLLLYFAKHICIISKQNVRDSRRRLTKPVSMNGSLPLLSSNVQISPHNKRGIGKVRWDRIA